MNVDELERVLTALDPDTGHDDWQLIHVSQGVGYAKSRREWAEAIASAYRSQPPSGDALRAMYRDDPILTFNAIVEVLNEHGWDARPVPPEPTHGPNPCIVCGKDARAVVTVCGDHMFPQLLSQPPSGDAPDLREALNQWLTSRRRRGNWSGPPEWTAEDGYNAAVEEVEALAASVPSSPATPAPLDVERDHDHHFDARCETCNWLAGKSPRPAYANQEGGEPRKEDR